MTAWWRRWMPVAGGVVLVMLYAGYYLANQSLPGNNQAAPLGWWGWFDQGQYIESARALRAADFSPAQNWFPLGYSLLAVPFIDWLPMHPFFFIDIAGLLVAYGGFLAVARRLDVAGYWAAPLFVLAAMGDPRLAETWAVPWNTTVSTALIWTAFALTAWQFGPSDIGADRWRGWRLAGFGLVLGAIPLVRPSDAIVDAIVVGFLAGAAVWQRRARLMDAASLGAGGLAVVIPYGVLYLRIYGWHRTAYVIQSQRLGFPFSQFFWKAYVLLIDPHPWFPDGVGLLARCPWIVLSLAGALPVLVGLRGVQRLIVGMLSAAILAYCVLFFSYIDLLPSGLWLYANVHYFQWVFPGLGLLAFLMLREFLGVRRRLAFGSLVVTMLVLSVRIAAVRVGDTVPARMVQFSGVTASWSKAYFGTEVLRDKRGDLPNIRSMRVLPDRQGLRAVALRRQFVGTVRWASVGALGPKAAGVVPLRWGERLSLGYPCWLPPYPCEVLPPRS